MRNINLGKAILRPRAGIVAGSFQTLTYTYTAGHSIDDSGYLMIAYPSSPVGLISMASPRRPSAPIPLTTISLLQGIMAFWTYAPTRAMTFRSRMISGTGSMRRPENITPRDPLSPSPGMSGAATPPWVGTVTSSLKKKGPPSAAAAASSFQGANQDSRMPRPQTSCLAGSENTGEKALLSLPMLGAALPTWGCTILPWKLPLKYILPGEYLNGFWKRPLARGTV